MTFASNVQPRRLVKQQGKRQPWTCKCNHEQHAAMKRCYECLAVRP